MLPRLVPLVLAGLLTGAAPAPPPQTTPVISLPSGAVAGQREAEVDAYLGIPYAAPPVGALRWVPPAEPLSWSGVRQATKMAPGCLQTLTPSGIPPWTPEYMAPGPVSEDCLYLNIWVPRKAPGTLPVMFWVHGGAFQSGSSAVPIYDGAALARQGIIVVSINYRLGAFGFLDAPAMGDAPGRGNFGLLDVIAALKWVRGNIASFGGDPGKVTVAGQSAGGVLVNSLLTSPLARGMFRAAIIESETISTIPPLPENEARAAGARFEDEVGVHDLAGLRGLPAEQILAANDRLRSRIKLHPTITADILPQAPFEVLQTGRRADVPVLAGINANEPFVADMNASRFREQATRLFGKDAGIFLAAYPADTDVQALRSARRSANDRLRANLVRWARLRAGRIRQPLFAYYFDHAETGPDAAWFGAFHSAEIPYIFGTLNRSPDRPFTAEDRVISKTMGHYWANFVKTGDPNGNGLPRWEPTGANGEPVMELGDRFGPLAPLPPSLSRLYDVVVDR